MKKISEIKTETPRTEYLFHKLRSCCGGGEATELVIVMNVKKGETKVKITHEISEYFDLKDYDQATHLYDCLTGGNGRRVYTPSDLAHWYIKNKYKSE